MSTITLYHNDMSVCAQKVRVALAELGLDWESRHMKLRGDEQFQPDYLRIHPKGLVPALVHGDLIVLESNVINEYLVDAHDADRLLPDSAAGRARMRWWTRQLDEDIHRSTGVMSLSISFLHQYKANGPEVLDQLLAAIPEEFRREQKRQALSTGLENPALPAAARRMNKLLGDMDAALRKAEWLAGDRYTLADIGMTSYVQRMEHLQMAMMFESRPALQAWWARIKARPSFAAAMERWFNPDYLVLTEKTGGLARPRIAEMLAAT
jgi:glutathione S-transferase